MANRAVISSLVIYYQQLLHRRVPLEGRIEIAVMLDAGMAPDVIMMLARDLAACCNPRWTVMRAAMIGCVQRGIWTADAYRAHKATMR